MRRTMSNSSSSGSSGISFVGLLQVLFIGLKLTNFIAWPWWQVLLPGIIYFGIVAVLLFILFVLTVISDRK
jgi:hypothetical protein